MVRLKASSINFKDFILKKSSAFSTNAELSQVKALFIFFLKLLKLL